MRKATSGFTIVELLIVIVVIAILAAISVVAYRGLQERARTSAHLAAIKQAENQIMAYALQANGESISIGGSLIGYREGAGDIQLIRPLTGTPDITLYAVYTPSTTAGYYLPIALLTPAVNASQRFQLQTGANGANYMGYRMDTPVQASLGYHLAGYRVANSTVIGWLQSNSSATVRVLGYNQASAQHSASVDPGSGWNFTGLTTANNDGTTHIALVFNAAHDQATRAQIIGWLANKYNVSL